MRTHRIYALGGDPYWLKAIAEIANESITVKPIRCPGSYGGYLDCLPNADLQGILLVDATSQMDIASVVQDLRKRNWPYIVVVAADPSWKEARDLLREGAAYDYWQKSYVLRVVRQQIEHCLGEIDLENEDWES